MEDIRNEGLNLEVEIVIRERKRDLQRQWEGRKIARVRNITRDMKK